MRVDIFYIFMARHTSELNVDDQAWRHVRAYYNHLLRILQIWRHVDDDCLRHLVHTFITLCLDHCNSLYAQRSSTTL